MTTRTSYRPDIDGLRAIAVSSVVAFHAFPSLAPPRSPGLDLSSLTSRLLITSILLRENSQGRFSLLDFYRRRIRRIFPALMLVLLSCLLAGWLLLFPDEMKQLGKHTLGANLFITNFLFWSEAGYFDTASELKPLLHLWSLSIEEQFYALWPLTLLLLLRIRSALAGTAVLTLSSVALCVSGALDPVANFYMPLARIWELLIGALLAYAKFSTAPRGFSSRWMSEVSSVAGIALLTVSIFWLINSKTLFPSWKSLLPTIGAALLIAAGPSALLNRHLLGSKPFVFVGLISYPLYLWHWPLLSFPKITEGIELPTTDRSFAVCLAVLLATFTYHFVEKPLRHRGGHTVAALLGLALVLALLGLGFWKGALQPKQSGELFQKIAAAKGDHSSDAVVSRSEVITLGGQELLAIGNGPRTTLYIGDSNMAQYWLGVEKTILDRQGSRRALLGGCWLPIRGLEMPAACRQTNEHLFSLARNDPHIDTVVISAQWRSLFSYNFIDHGQAYPVQRPGSRGMQLAQERLIHDIRDLIDRGKRVYIVLNIPSGPEFDPHNLIQRSLKGFHISPHLEGGISLQQHHYIVRTLAPVTPILEHVAKESGARLLDPADFLCREGWCSAVTKEGEPIYSDSDHLRASFSYYYPEFIAQTLTD